MYLFCLDNIFYILFPVLTVRWWIYYWHAYIFCLYTVFVCLKAESDLHFLRHREASRIAVESVWPVSYVVSRVTVFLTAQYFKARFVWKCLHSTCTAVGLAVFAFIRLSVYSFGALICCSTCSLHLISALYPLLSPYWTNLFISVGSCDCSLIRPACLYFLSWEDMIFKGFVRGYPFV